MGYSNNRGKDRGHATGASKGRERGRRTTGGRGGYGGNYGRYGGGTGSNSRFAPSNAPVEVGKEYLVQITELSQRGEGVTKIQGFVIFIPGGKPDSAQKVRIKIERVGPRFASASLVVGSDASTSESTKSDSFQNEKGNKETSTKPGASAPL